mmetsp:Transcript_37718/g.98788  ORF Transcript_37718/g.98788 Transcript_37718/m.98788 type:complete len:206 (-) Transcript_37718:993-1610(-)
MMASIGTPSGEFQSESRIGHCDSGAVNREFGWAAGLTLGSTLPDGLRVGCHPALPFQSVTPHAGTSSMPSQYTSPSSVTPTLVKSELDANVAIALGLVFIDVPGATPKNPFSGLTARMRPSAPKRSHAMSSPMVSTFHPGSDGVSIARLVLPQADGNAAQMYRFSPAGLVIPRMSMCSASHPSSRPCADAIRSATHFLPNNAFPP